MPSPDSSAEWAGLPEIHMAGFLKSTLGLGEAGRLMAHGMEAAGVPFSTRSWQKDDKLDTASPSPAATAPEPSTASARNGISLLSMNGDYLTGVVAGGGAPWLDQRYVISVWFWETPDMPAATTEGFRFVDEVWTASPFVQQILEKHSNGIPIRLFTLPVIPPQGTREAALARFPLGERFVFLFTFNYQSEVMRKNPEGACAAFAAAFPEPAADGPLCVIKSMASAQFPVDHALLRQHWAHRPDILFMDDFLSAQDRDLLVHRSDACLSLHRAEGLGLSLLEAMACGKPCIATGYSGNLAFMTPENSWLIPWKTIPAGPGSLHFSPDQTWADPDLPAAAAAIREVAAGGPEVQRRAAAGQAWVLTHHDPRRCGQEIGGLFRQAATRPIRPKPIPSSGRSAVFQSLAQLRGMESCLNAPPPSAWETLTSLRHLSKDLERPSRARRRTLSHLLEAAKNQQRLEADALDNVQRHLERLTQQLCTLIRRLPRNPPV
jgi:glycosyltransferase involved in cell wall biosynthesis